MYSFEWTKEHTRRLVNAVTKKHGKKAEQTAMLPNQNTLDQMKGKDVTLEASNRVDSFMPCTCKECGAPIIFVKQKYCYQCGAKFD